MPPKPYTLPAYVENVSLWDHGKVVYLENQCGLSGYLLYTVQRANVQAKCAVFDEDVEILKNQGKVIEVEFKEPVNITISQWIKPEDRKYIQNRVLVNVEKIVFVLEGKFGGYILTKSANMQEYRCWAIRKDGEIDKSWIGEVENAIFYNKIVNISKQHPDVKKYLEQYPNATYNIRRVYLTSDGLVYQVDEQWRVKDFESVGSVGGKPVDGKDHYCWAVCWSNPEPGIEHVIVVFIDKDSYEIVFV